MTWLMTCDIIILCANLDPSFVTGQVITYKMVFSGLGKTCVKTHVVEKKLTKVKNIGEFKEKFSLWIKIFVYGWLYFIYNEYNRSQG